MKMFYWQSLFLSTDYLTLKLTDPGRRKFFFIRMLRIMDPCAPLKPFSGILFKKIILTPQTVFVSDALHIGAVAQLGERMTGSHEVRGSIPLSSTKRLQRVR
jgi:hypothetical protein